MDPETTETIRNFKTPENGRDVQSYIGFINFYRKYIPNLAETIIPLIKLTKKDQKWSWNEEHQKAFK